MMSQPKITVVVITYNQEDLIGRALDSILQQIEYIYEVIVADDCSPDGTWEKVLAYQERYPGVVKAYRNPKNLGIVGNIQFTWTKINGNLIYYCSGDDVLCDGLLKHTVKRMEHEQIDYDNDTVAIYCDYAEVRPDGTERIFRQDLVERFNAFDLKLRGLLSNRSMAYSKALLLQLRPVDGDLGLHEDGLLDCQIQYLSKKSYYFRFIGSKYYSGIGVSVNSDRVDLQKSEIATLEKCLSFFKLSDKNALWIRYDIARVMLSIDLRASTLLTFIRLYFENLDFKYGMSFVVRETKKVLRKIRVYLIAS